MTSDRVRHTPRDTSGNGPSGTLRPGGEERYRQLFNELLDGVALHEIVCDGSGRPIDYIFLDVNPAFERLTGLRAPDILGRRALEVIPDLEPEWIERYGRVALTGAPDHFENYNAAIGRHFEVRAYRPAAGQFAAVFRDVTDRLRAEAEVRDQRAFAETIIASAGEGMIVYDLDLRFRVWNPVMEELTGLPATRVLGRDAFELFPEVMATGVGLDLDQARSGESSTSREFEFAVARTGKRGWVLQTNRPHRDAGGEIIGVVSSVRDITARHEMDEAIRRSEEQLRAIFDSVGDGVAIHEPYGKFVEVNRVVCERLGYTREELLDMGLADIVAPSAAPFVSGNVELTLQGGVHSFESTHLRRNGTEIPVEVVTRRIEFRGRPAILAVHRDITERTKANEALREQARLMQQLLDAIPSAIAAKDRDGRLQMVNDAFVQVIGHDHGRVIGKTVAELGMPDAELQAARDRQVLDEGTIVSYESDTTPIDGPRLRLLMTKAPLRSQTGEITGIVSVALDISDRYRVEQALRLSEERFRRLFESAGDAIFMLDPTTGYFIEVNKATCERLGYSREELLGLTPLDVDTPEYAATFPERLKTIMARGSLSFETGLKRRDGAEIPVDMSATMVELEGRRILLAIARDISERKRAEAERAELEEQLRQAQKMEEIGRLAGGIAHDFNNLLTAIRGSASLALASLPPGDGPRDDLEQIEQAADRAAGLTRQLLAFARRTVLQPEVVDLGEIVRRLEPLLHRLIGEDIRLLTSVPDNSNFVLADPGQIEQVIVNLAVNAADAMPVGGTLRIEIAGCDGSQGLSEFGPCGPMTSISVTDTGHGMDAETLKHAFEPFFTTKGPGKGTGLGLATVYGIVRQSGGSVSADSRPGVGSTFTVRLPRVAPTAPSGTDAPAVIAAPLARTGTILVVEDDSGVRQFASRVLEVAGYKILTASDGFTAVEVARSHAIDLLLTDVVMPGMSGREVALKLAEARPEIRVLYMSGHTDKGIVHDGVLEPDIDFLAKPFTASALLAAVDDVLAKEKRD